MMRMASQLDRRSYKCGSCGAHTDTPHYRDGATLCPQCVASLPADALQEETTPKPPWSPAVQALVDLYGFYAQTIGELPSLRDCVNAIIREQDALTAKLSALDTAVNGCTLAFLDRENAMHTCRQGDLCATCRDALPAAIHALLGLSTLSQIRGASCVTQSTKGSLT